MATTTTGLKVTGLTTGYRGHRVFQGLNLPALRAGSLIGVLGPNAVGKSTLLKALAGLHPAQGEIRLGGIELSALRGVQRMRHVGYLPQTLPQATSLVAYEAVASACRVARPELQRDAIETLIEAVFDRLSLRSLALTRLEAMSGGQRQMVGLAQALVREPDLLLLDEPTSALDLRWQLALIEAVRDTVTCRGATCLMALHDINLALRHCDRVLLLGPGGLLAEGEPHMAITPDALRSAYGIRARIEHCSLGRPLVLTDGVAE
ncbi:ABC transporter ATP-binding protein [Chromohalobacter canadensis]|uniref:ABC transporter ATP-binding protein n=1 Tax=Chromohalobacter canadensis TaxID=141389 RepID=UPI0021BEDEFF|nr:ABC transporter ATP-binding protein [Chromohalobacter canadensis]MCT8467746.1 ABC transporter ATP-binding protein [Chromohalobacter canadensis]MCT8470506.1 ABC transporter ATP-binding protein [Chromohalobacter canadensis]MCT8498243.1 ABC transporter ATP-binding protein [Chromohalobacter canadensis]